MPAALEPAQILMLSAGLALVGGWVTFHRVRLPALKPRRKACPLSGFMLGISAHDEGLQFSKVSWLAGGQVAARIRRHNVKKSGVTMSMKKTMGAVLLALGLALTAHAQESIAAADGRHKHDDGGAPAAPEPYLIVMLAGGLGLVGGYVVYRVRKNNAK